MPPPLARQGFEYAGRVARTFGQDSRPLSTGGSGRSSDDLRMGDYQVGAVSFYKIRAGILGVDEVLTVGTSGAQRVDIVGSGSNGGIKAYNSGGTLVGQWASQTGALWSVSGGFGGSLAAPAVQLESAGLNVSTSGVIRSGATAILTGDGWWMDYNAGTPRTRVGTVSGGALVKGYYWDGAIFTVKGTLYADAGQIGGFDVGTDYVRDTANSFGLASTATGADDIRFWAGATFANRGTAPVRITEQGYQYLGSTTAELLSNTWTNHPTTNAYETFAAAANAITSAINSAGNGSASDGAFAAQRIYVRVGARYLVTGNLTLNSGAAPDVRIWATDGWGNTPLTDAQTTSAGAFSVVITGAAEGWGQLWFSNTTAANWSCTAISMKHASGLIFEGPNSRIRSSDYMSGAAGWDIEPAFAEFGNAYIRGEMHSTVWVRNLISAHAGTLGVYKSAGKVNTDMAVPGVGTWTMVCDNPPGASPGWLFDNSDICMIKVETVTDIYQIWFTVTQSGAIGATTQSYVCTWQNGTRGITYPAGSPVIDYGVSGNGGLLMTADLANAPYYDVRTHVGAPWTTETVRVRMGLLTGVNHPVTGVPLTGQWGLWTDNVYLSGVIVSTSGQIGGFNIGADYLRDAADSFGLASTVTGGDDVRGWAGATFANRATAPLRWTEAGALTCTNITATGGTIGGWTLSATQLSAASNIIVLDKDNGIRVLSESTATVNSRFSILRSGWSYPVYRIWGFTQNAPNGPLSYARAEVLDTDSGSVAGTFQLGGGLTLSSPAAYGDWAITASSSIVSIGTYATPGAKFGSAGLYPGNQTTNYLAGNATGIGVNRTAATDVWEVLGNMRAMDTGNNNRGFSIQRNQGGGSYNTTWTMYIPASSTDLRFYNGADLVWLTASGSLGVGVTPSSAKFVVQTGDDAVQIANFTGLNSGIRFQSNASRMDFISHNGADSATRDLLIRQYGASVGILIDTTDAITMGHYGAGTATFDANGKISSVSDIRLKHVQRPFLAELADIQPIVYKWRKESGLDTEHEYAGFSAQELEACDPLMVGRDADGMLTMQDRAVMAAMVNTINSLKKQVAHLEARVS